MWIDKGSTTTKGTSARKIFGIYTHQSLLVPLCLQNYFNFHGIDSTRYWKHYSESLDHTDKFSEPVHIIALVFLFLALSTWHSLWSSAAAVALQGLTCCAFTDNLLHTFVTVVIWVTLGLLSACQSGYSALIFGISMAFWLRELLLIGYFFISGASLAISEIFKPSLSGISNNFTF